MELMTQIVHHVYMNHQEKKKRSVDHTNENKLHASKAKRNDPEILHFIQSLLGSLKRLHKSNPDFVIMEEGVWFHWNTGLVLPDYSRNTYIGEVYTPGGLHKLEERQGKKNLKLSFGTFIGRLPSENECCSIFDGTTPGMIKRKLTISARKASVYAKGKNYSIQRSTVQKDKVISYVYADENNYRCYSLASKRGICLNNVDNSRDVFILPVYSLCSPKNDDSGDEYWWQVLEQFGQHHLTPVLFSKEETSLFEQYCWQYLEIATKRSEKAKTKQQKPAANMAAVYAELLQCDTIRANITPYPKRIIEDINSGHWELFEQDTYHLESAEKIDVRENLVARPPKMDIHESGICAIDFGTKSTVVVCRNQDERLLRIGKGDYRKAPQPSDYENPTAMEIRDMKSFKKSYDARLGRPFTQWEHLTVSHQALASLLEQEEKESYQCVFCELKQWANGGAYIRRLCDRKGKSIVLKPYAELTADDFDPIEYYAYYLGLYINNMVNGIYLDYILSFPVTYSKEIRKRLLRSFEAGIKKSLPPTIVADSDLMEDFRIYAGASEPAAYAACALKELGKRDESLQPTEDMPIYYAVFDFGGGTTDFDFGIWRLPKEEEKRYNYVIEHFGAGGDPLLGGENLLRVMAYEVFKDNIDSMREKNVPFVLPKECKAFAGAELLLNTSDAAQLNIRRLSECLRPIWEEREGYEKIGESAENLILFTDESTVSVALHIDIESLQTLLRERIKEGIENFFLGLMTAFKDKEAARIDILLAGNSCKSRLVQQLFAEKIACLSKEIQNSVLAKKGQIKDTNGVFVLHQPLGEETADARPYDTVPTAKTGVAFGLLDCRKGGNDVKVIDRNLSEEKEAPFRYYLGRIGRNDLFTVLIPKESPYGEWEPLFETDDDRFELYYTAEPRALDGMLTTAEIAPPKKCRLHYTGDEEEGMIYVRKVSPTKIEYTVASADGIEDAAYYAKVESCELK